MAAGTAPYVRKSDEFKLLSPSIQTCPSGTTNKFFRCDAVRRNRPGGGGCSTTSPGKPNTLLQTVPCRSGCCTMTTSPTLIPVMRRVQNRLHLPYGENWLAGVMIWCQEYCENKLCTQSRTMAKIGRRHKGGTGRMMHKARAVVAKQTSLTKVTMMRRVSKQER
jgi:hypothetical protein